MQMIGDDPAFTVSDFVAVCNQTLEFAYPSVLIVGELANLRVSKNRWVYFDLKDESSSVKFFGTVQQLPGPLEDGLMMQVRGAPRLHNLYGFSVNVQFMQPVGKGSIRKAGELLAAKLEAEGLFDASRKRPLPCPPTTVGLITSGESAAYRDFIKILNERWAGVGVQLADVQVQGEPAITQVVAAIEYFNAHDAGVDVLVVTRGGGSADDLAVFSSEQVTRAVAASRIPTIVAIGHEVDVSLAELAADQRASTPSNAAQLLVPDKRQAQERLNDAQLLLTRILLDQLADAVQVNVAAAEQLHTRVVAKLQGTQQQLERQTVLLRALDPLAALRRGYALVRAQTGLVRSVADVHMGQAITLQMHDGMAHASIISVSSAAAGNEAGI